MLPLASKNILGGLEVINVDISDEGWGGAQQEPSDLCS